MPAKHADQPSSGYRTNRQAQPIGGKEQAKRPPPPLLWCRVNQNSGGHGVEYGTPCALQQTEEV
ncbi:hypothetical protein H8S21_20630 [Erwinia persicina]|uniref:hypothetical protein n=1 Tax=Erwinia persicina TaxID=55211 RepID=UPI0016547FB8|nr:hypothetical protein [Erwinia persicina]MBC3947734.1 hypothetical protein [Erwinia persicina]